jgi:hypothetical protein
MNWTIDPKRLAHVFALATEEVWASSGDGDGFVSFASANIQSVAAAFEEWQRQHSICAKWPMVRSADESDRVTFSRDQENLTFQTIGRGDSMRPLPWRPEIWLEVW